MQVEVGHIEVPALALSAVGLDMVLFGFVG